MREELDLVFAHALVLRRQDVAHLVGERLREFPLVAPAPAIALHEVQELGAHIVPEHLRVLLALVEPTDELACRACQRELVDGVRRRVGRQKNRRQRAH